MAYLPCSYTGGIVTHDRITAFNLMYGEESRIEADRTTGQGALVSRRTSLIAFQLSPKIIER